ncbi:hypothetical protein EN35_00935 [Rhodococcus qingshengii]|nr:hypothetical protein EN35_00935 [Rhodococcus qingshengii]
MPPEVVLRPLRDVGTFAVRAVKALAEILVELRSVSQNSLTDAVEDSIGAPSGLPSDLTMIGGTAPAVITLATRPLPCCAAYRTTSPPPVEWPTRTRSFRSSVSISSARSLAYVSMSLPVYVFDERPCPRRSCAMVR